MPEPAIKIEFPQEHLTTLVEKWVLEQIPGEKRDEILAQAVAHLMAPRKDSYGRTTVTPLEEAFNRAVETVMHKVVRDMVTGRPEIVAKIEAEVGKALHDFFQTGHEYPGQQFHQKMAEAFSTWFHERP